MTKRAAFIFWICVIAIQITGATMDLVGGNLDDPIRLTGTLLLTPGLAVIWGWMGKHLPASPATYAGMLGIAVVINLAIAAIIHAFLWTIRRVIYTK